jgi:hypothetical protein
METALFEVKFYDGRKFNVFCKNKTQKQKFFHFILSIKDEIESWHDVANGIHELKDFLKITTNKL